MKMMNQIEICGGGGREWGRGDGHGIMYVLEMSIRSGGERGCLCSLHLHT